VPTETVRGERRVALVPDCAGRLVKQGLTVPVRAGAGEDAGFAEAAYAAAGCAIATSAAAAMQDAGLVVKIQGPTMDEAAGTELESTPRSVARVLSDNAPLKSRDCGTLSGSTAAIPGVLMRMRPRRFR
jgi:NAD(P) transhydrogenase subunit alpha